MAPSLELQSNLTARLSHQKLVSFIVPWSSEEKIVSGDHHQGHLHDLPDSKDRPHGGPAEDVAHVHPELDQLCLGTKTDIDTDWSLVMSREDLQDYTSNPDH